jgi:hypothetical protein
MPLQRDYIQRIVEAMAKAIAAIVTFRKQGETQAARDEITRTSGSLFGLDLGLIELMGPATVAAQLGHPEKVEALAQLVDEKALVEREAGEVAAAERWVRLAAGLRAAVA